jgi:hypothetical protein
MTMTVPVIIAIIGGIALLIGLLGGGVEVEKLKIPRLPVQVRIFLSIVGIVCIGVAAWLFISGEQKLSTAMTTTTIEITKPIDNAIVTCDETLGTDQCYINVTGTADVEPGFQICLFLKFQGTSDPWWVGGHINANEIPDSKVWKVSHVGIGEVNAKSLPPILITAVVTDVSCSIGTQFANLPESTIKTTIQVQRK